MQSLDRRRSDDNMSIRWKLNLSVLAMIFVFLTAMLFVMRAVQNSATHTQTYAGWRNKSQFLADLRTDVFCHVGGYRGPVSTAEVAAPAAWLDAVLPGIEDRVRQASGAPERRLWTEVRTGIVALVSQAVQADRAAIMGELETDLSTLRQLIVLEEHQAVNAIAKSNSRVRTAVITACAATVLLFLAYLSMMRDWLLKPIETLKASTEAIGQGSLQHRVPLDGHDELAQLARRIDAMTDSLARHQAELLEARELSAIGELCTNVAHGLRNPLAGIRASAQLAERQATDAEKVQALIGDLVSEADRMDQRIVKLFEFAKPLTLHRDCMTFGEWAQAVRAETDLLLRRRDVSLAVDDQTRGHHWCMDREKMVSALSELVTNAIHHSTGGGRVTLRGVSATQLGGEGPQLDVQVIDKGAGMLPDSARQAFELFFTTRPQGTGMGLAIVRRIVREHNGEVSLESQPGEGTTITVTLPALCPRVKDPNAVCQSESGSDAASNSDS